MTESSHATTPRWVPEPPTWWQRGVVYQIYPRSFADRSGDGVGDLAGIREHTDYLAWLGIDAVWMSPIYPSPGVDLGYDISDYRSIDPTFGTLEDFDGMLSEFHARGIRLILDLVPNHTSDRHPWFAESRRGPDDPRHEWYVWRDGRQDGAPPNNWESYFGGSAWTFLDPPGRWYLHSFAPEQPDLNWDLPNVRREMLGVMRFWLDRGVDGFRVDVLWLLGKDPEFRDNPPNSEWREGVPAYLRLLRAYSEDGPRAHEYARLLRSVVDEYPDRVMIGEVVLPPQRAVAYYGSDLREAHMPHNFALTELTDWSAERIREVVDGYESTMPERAWPNWLLGDHDFSRIASRLGQQRTRLAQMLLLTLRGTPTCYYGDELGMIDARATAQDDVVDPQAAIGADRDRLVARSPMQWQQGPAAGFSSREPWLPIASGDAELTVRRQREDPSSMLRLFRSLVWLRRKVPALAVGSYAPMDAPGGVFSFERWHPRGTAHVHLNFGDRRVEFGLRSPARVLLTTRGDSPGMIMDRLTLDAYAGAIVEPASAGVPERSEPMRP